MFINSTSLIGKIELYWRQLIKLRKVDLLNMINTHRWLKQFPNQSTISQNIKIMTELSTVMEKNDNLGIGREIHEGWVGNERYQFPS